MNAQQIAVWALCFVTLYPPLTAAFWMAGGLVFLLLDERASVNDPEDGWPGVTVLVPAYNEEPVIGRCVHELLEVDYPELEVVVLDDGSTDGTVAAAESAGRGDPRFRVHHDGVNRGKADRLNVGFGLAHHELVLVNDADTHLHPLAPKLLVARMLQSPLNVAVAGSPHVTNRTNLLCAMQVLEAASIIGLIRRAGSLRGRVGTVAGVLGLFRRDSVLAVGGYDGKMATEDIDLSWRLLLAGGHTLYEPDALVGMQVPSTFRALWAQRRRWARGQGEVLHEHGRAVLRWRHRALVPLPLESLASLVWVVAWAVALIAAAVASFVPSWHSIFGFGLAWGVAIAVVSTVQLALALAIESRYDRRAPMAFLLGPLYPMFFWAVSAAAALRSEIPALVRGPREHRVVWDIPREAMSPPAPEVHDPPRLPGS